MPVSAVLAVVAGLIGLLVAVQLLRASAEVGDPTMVWEGRVALGFGALLLGGPCWLAQLVLTLVATLRADASGWLWLWWVGAPGLGAALGALARRASSAAH